MNELIKQQNRKGFTLVELLVVVSIIAILSTIGLVVFTDSQKNARDARRKADIDAVAKAIEAKRTPASATYNSISGTDFSSGAFPTDSTTAQYCFAESATTAIASSEPVTWAAGSICPTVTANVFGTAAFNGTITNTTKFWKVCARLENNTFYCKNSAQ